MPAMPVEPYLLAIYSIPSNAARRELLAVNTQKLLDNLKNEALKIGGEQIGDWMALPSDAGVDDLDRLTHDMGGVVYDLITGA